jgi:hypothetical protein
MGKGYRDGDAPWRFSGRALYQLNLVKSSEARKHVPADLKLVELFGYTLGGVYLARYEDSPAGTFDEMVALGGLVWNPPTSCAWAARVFVNDERARAHGVKTCGLPSALARFDDDDEKSDAETRRNGWWKNVKPLSVFAKARAFVLDGKNKKRFMSRSETVRLRDGDTGAEVCALALPGAGRGAARPADQPETPEFQRADIRVSRPAQVLARYARERASQRADPRGDRDRGNDVRRGGERRSASETETVYGRRRATCVSHPPPPWRPPRP